MTPADDLILKVFRELHGRKHYPTDNMEIVGDRCRTVGERCGVPASRVWLALHRQEAAS